MIKWQYKDLDIVRVQNPKNKHNYLLIVDKVSSSTHFVIGPRKIRSWGLGAPEFTDEQIECLKKLRIVETIQNNIHYPLINML